MDAFPAFVPLAGARVVVAGEGEAADAKARLFDGSPATVVRLSGAPALDPAAYAGARLAFVAGDAAFCEGAARAGRAGGALVNVVDRPAMSDFFTPAIVDRGAVVGAIGTGGAAPVLASRLRAEGEARWPPGLGRLAEVLRAVQDQARAALPDAADRRAWLRALLDGPAARAALAGEVDEARRLATAALATPEPRRGSLCRLAAPDEPDLLTLRDLQVLSRADRVVIEGEVHPAVLAYARRDALRIYGSAAEAETFAGAGEAVVLVLAAVVTGDGGSCARIPR